jgi:5-methyltetrahydropteroyltriglutamate--homocysteine methyltransferase
VGVLLRSSHVGSFPLEYNFNNVERILVDLAFLGLDVPPYPQLRGFVDIYLEPLVKSGVVFYERGFFYSSPEKICSWRGVVSVPEAEYAISIVKKRKLEFKGLRAPVTGPFTLASRIYLSKESVMLSNTMLTLREIVEEFFKKYVSLFVEYMATLGYSVIFLDEPILGVIIGSRRNLYGYSDIDIVEVLDHVAKQVGNIELGIHVCGRIHRRIFEILAQTTRIKYISLEFHDNPSNIEVIDKSLLEKYDKIISPGIISTKIPKLESEEEAYTLLEKIYNVSSGRVDLISGDCGFGGLRGALGNSEEEYKLALLKLERVIKACKRLETQKFH